MIEQFDKFLNEEPPRKSPLIDEIILKAKRKYSLFLAFTIFISLFCFGMVVFIEYPDLQNAIYFLLFCIIVFVLPAYIFKRIIMRRVRIISTNGNLLKGVVVTSNKLKGWNQVGIEANFPELKKSIAKFSLIPMNPFLVVGENIPMLYYPECQSIIIGYFKKCGFEIGHLDRINNLKWLLILSAVLAIIGIILWMIFF